MAGNYYRTKSGTSPFVLQSNGLIAGFALDDQLAEMFMSDGVLGGTTPIWGGLPVKNAIGTPGGLNGTLFKAAAYAEVTGWSVANHAAHPVTDSDSIGIYRPGQTVHFLPTGIKARIAVEIDSALAATLISTGFFNTQVSWDFTNNKIIAFATTALPVTIEKISLSNNRLVSYNSGTGNASFTNVGAVAVIRI